MCQFQNHHCPEGKPKIDMEPFVQMENKRQRLSANKKLVAEFPHQKLKEDSSTRSNSSTMESQCSSKLLKNSRNVQTAQDTSERGVALTHNNTHATPAPGLAQDNTAYRSPPPHQFSGRVPIPVSQTNSLPLILVINRTGSQSDVHSQTGSQIELNSRTGSQCGNTSRTTQSASPVQGRTYADVLSKSQTQTQILSSSTQDSSPKNNCMSSGITHGDTRSMEDSHSDKRQRAVKAHARRGGGGDKVTEQRPMHHSHYSERGHHHSSKPLTVSDRHTNKTHRMDLNLEPPHTHSDTHTHAHLSSNARFKADQELDSLNPETVELWLDSHPDFAHAYFTRRATRSMVDNWLLSNAQKSSPDSCSSDASSCSAASVGSGANTPVRKISAQEFEKDGQILKRMISTVDGQVSFLASSISSGGDVTKRSKPKLRSDFSEDEKSREDERELMYSLVMDICHDLDVTSLCHKILQNVSVLLNADRCSLFLVQGEGSERYLVSKLFDVNSNSTIADCTDRGEEIRVPFGCGIAGTVAETGSPLNIHDAYQDARFNRSVDIVTGYKTRSILCMPIHDSCGEVIGVAEAINKCSISQEPFTERDEKVFSSYLAFCGIGLRNAQLYERSQLENRRNQLMLDLARVIFEQQKDVASLIHKIMMHTQSLLQCARCQVLLVDEIHKGLFSQVFDLQASDFDNNDEYHREGSHEPRFPINIGITGHVARTGETLNIPDAYADDRFDQAVDTEDFKTESILCMAIKNAQGHVVGVAQFVNKLDHTPFNKNDENLFEAFAIFCGMGINNTVMYEKACKARARQQVALEVLSYHARAPECEVARLQKGLEIELEMPLYDFSFDDTCLDDDGTLRACVRMFRDLNLTRRFSISNEVLCRWLLSTKKNYRDVTYHNWRHAFNVAHTMFCMITLGSMRGTLSDSEVLALLVACLSHDLDHRGTNNQFQIKTSAPLAQLYSTSTMEHHHFDQCIMILNTKGSDILSQLRQDEYESVIKILENAILATDLALYFRYRGEFFRLVEAGSCDWNQANQKELLRAMMMTACDVSAISKPWATQKKVAEMIYNEFFEQGDLEKERLHIKPIDIMNRDKADELPRMQVGFIDTICLPVYEHLSRVNAKLQPLEKGCLANRDKWTQLANESKSDED